MTAQPEPPHLRAVDRPEREALDGEGLALAYAALERVRAERRLHRLSVLVDDPALGRQVLGVPRDELPSIVDDRLGWSAEPELADPAMDIELAVALCRTALRVEVATGPLDAVELALRRLTGVEAVAIAVEGDVIRVRVADMGSETVMDEVLGVVKAELDRAILVEVTRAGPSPARAASEPLPVDPSPVELLAVRTTPESGGLEVHLRAGEVRTVGRSALSRGLIGAAEAVLEAWHARPGAPARRVAWARTVETSAGARFVVAVAVEVPTDCTASYGIATGPNPAEAAVRATVEALGR